ncbi:MFS transporter [Paenibacillus physcomitrellae]|uniref:MFS transporter n=1 Tax=Paenibacillus physcomitrellae TaxID=1619311 RepID=A0ABQ1FTK1_9BACL|nr:MFS transporter [Paenibacillus physcomitrellae]GGA29187.1 MFS transporter [Paenibacillus physcomitrellae]
MNARSWWMMISIGLGILLNPLNSSMVSVAIPGLQKEFHLDFTTASWIIFSFYIASASAQPIVGKASDLFGRRRIFLTGLWVSLVVSILAPLSVSFGWIIFFRIVQSIGTSMMAAVGMALVRIHITEKQATALSVLSIFLSGAAALGPFIGGVLLDWWNWPAIFWINLPFVIAGILLAWRTIPQDGRSKPAIGGQSLRKWLSRLDAAGVLLFTTGLVALLVGLLSAIASRHLSWVDLLLGLSGLVVLLIFVWHETRTVFPFIPLLTLARYPAVTRVNIQFILVNVLYYSIFFGFPSYLQTVRHISEFDTGLLMLSLGVCSLAASPWAGKWMDKSGPRPALLTSALFMTLGSLGMLLMNVTSSLLWVCLALAAFGISNGLNNVGMQAALFQSSPKEIIGVASGLFNTSRYLGTILSSLLTSIIMGGSFSIGGFKLLGGILAAVALTLAYMSRQLRGQVGREL